MISSQVLNDKLEEHLLKKSLGLYTMNSYQPLYNRYCIWITETSFSIWSVDKSKVIYHGLIADQLNKREIEGIRN